MVVESSSRVRRWSGRASAPGFRAGPAEDLRLVVVAPARSGSGASRPLGCRPPACRPPRPGTAAWARPRRTSMPDRRFAGVAGRRLGRGLRLGGLVRMRSPRTVGPRLLSTILRVLLRIGYARGSSGGHRRKKTLPASGVSARCERRGPGEHGQGNGFPALTPSDSVPPVVAGHRAHRGPPRRTVRSVSFRAGAGCWPRPAGRWSRPWRAGCSSRA